MQPRLEHVLLCGEIVGNSTCWQLEGCSFACTYLSPSLGYSEGEIITHASETLMLCHS
jgi:hypothetical protein